jgi:hypothetical protein
MNKRCVIYGVLMSLISVSSSILSINNRQLVGVLVNRPNASALLSGTATGVAYSLYAHTREKQVLTVDNHEKVSGCISTQEMIILAELVCIGLLIYKNYR